MRVADRLAAWRRNPFFVLDVSVTASAMEIERAGQRLIALLAIGSTDAASYDTPFGFASRDADAARDALAKLRDPEERVVFEVLAKIVRQDEVPRTIDLEAAGKEVVEALVRCP